MAEGVAVSDGRIRYVDVCKAGVSFSLDEEMVDENIVETLFIRLSE